ncbi:MAG: hypothetical protein FJ267_04125 [Planctomycetes bacterium]|nr:hypothetical protein [Planctomycetota bacterium]
MYETFFRLKRRPFGATPNAQCFLTSREMQGALDEIVVCIEQGQGIAVVSAPAGVGKTLLCERLRHEVGERFETIVLPHASFLTRRALLQTILCELGHSYSMPDEQELRLELIPAIRVLRPEREALVLICDEAHQLSTDLLEELRILSDLADQGRPLVRLVLVGQPSLEETLAEPGLEALSQRIRAAVCLNPFDQAGSADYVDYRLTWAGGRTEEIFDQESMDLICRAADGVPRCLNQLCDHALLLGYVAEQKPVLIDTIEEALADLRQLPLHWNQPISRNEVPREFRTTIAATELTEIPMNSNSMNSNNVIEFGDSASHEICVETESTEAEVDSPAIEVGNVTSNTLELEGNPISQSHGQAYESDLNSMTMSSPTRMESIGITRNTPACTIASAIQRSQFREELVIDRYAAIDAGIDPSSLPQDVNQVIQEASFHQECLNAPLEEMITTSDSFAGVCERLEEHLPSIVESSCWTPESVRTAVANGTIWECPDETVQEDDSVLEDVTITKAEFEQVHLEESFEAPAEVVETSIVQVDAPHRPYRNLFSQLRRKQHGFV